MKKTELDKLNIQKPEGVFAPNYTFLDILLIKNENGEVVDYEYTDFVLNKSAEEIETLYNGLVIVINSIGKIKHLNFSKHIIYMDEV